MTARRHGIIRIGTEDNDWTAGGVTARARCACGAWRHAGQFSGHPGRAGAILLVIQRFDCGSGPLDAHRAARPFPADPASLEDAASELDRKAAGLRAEAARLLEQAAEYGAGSERLRADRQALGA
jgi:Lon protease-like protein